jgi:hypothetical protein
MACVERTIPGSCPPGEVDPPYLAIRISNRRGHLPHALPAVLSTEFGQTQRSCSQRNWCQINALSKQPIVPASREAREIKCAPYTQFIWKE